MKSEKLLPVLKRVLSAFARRERGTRFAIVYFKAGTVTVSNSFYSVSAKVDIESEQLISKECFNFLGSYAAQRDLHVRFKKGTFFLLDRAINEFSTPFHRFNDIPDLWDRQIKWLDCPIELIAGIDMVRPFAAARDSNPVLRSVQIDSMFVVGADNFSLCRYKLPSPVPFAFNLPSYSSKPLSEFKGERQLRIASHHISNTAGDGVLFDLGYFRSWLMDSS